MAPQLAGNMSLRTKAVMVVLLIIVGLLAVNAAAVIFAVRRHIAGAEQQMASTMARSLASSSELAVAVGDVEELKRLTQGYLWSNDVLFAAILDSRGRLLSHAGKSEQEVQRAIDVDNPPGEILVGRHAVHLVDFGRNLTVFDQTTTGQESESTGSIVGYAVVALPTTRMHQAQHAMTRLVIVVAAVALLFSLILVSMTVGNWARRLDAIVSASEQIRAGDFSGELIDEDADEIGRLARAYNLMRNAVQQRDVELRQFNETLQLRVEQRTAELEESEARIRAILESAVDGILTVDAMGRIESSNPAANDIFGYDRTLIIGTQIDELFRTRNPDDDSTSPLKQIDAAQLPAQLEAMGRRSSGERFPVYVSLNDVELDGRRAFVVIVHDLTEHYRLERQLAQAQKLEAIGQLAAGIAHEINTPIQFIGDNTRFMQEAFEDIGRMHQAYAELLSATSTDERHAEQGDRIRALADELDLDFLNEEIPRAIEQAREGVDRVARIVRSMKEFAHPGGEGMSAVHLNKSIDNTITVARNEWKYVADVNTDYDPALPAITCLPGELNQVLLNIIVNAAHAIEDAVGGDPDKKGRIDITTRKDGDWVEIRISDTGKGIPQHVRDRIFDPFFTTKPVGKGTGQGLAIAHNVIVDKHKGTIACESNADGGACFIIRLPITPATEKVGT